jgi:SPP1 family predicted phage head-tail adaptor
MGQGKLAVRNILVTIERQSTSQDSTGQQLDSWTEVGKEWVSIRPVTGREYFNASGERAEVTHRIRMVYGRTFAPKDRIVYGSRIFDIKSVINIEERNRELELMVTEHVT